MSTINTSYAAMQYGMNTAQKIRQQDSRKADTGEKVKETGETQSTETKKLSKKAQDVLKKLKDKYGNIRYCYPVTNWKKWQKMTVIITAV